MRFHRKRGFNDERQNNPASFCPRILQGMRVLKPYGTLIFKWNETQIPVKDVITAIGHKPLYGNRSGKQGKTHWMAFVKEVEQ